MRQDIYGRIHKALRTAMFELSCLHAQTDFTDDAEVSTLQTKAAEMVYFLIDHGHKEDTFYLAPLEQRAPGATAHDAADHVEIEARIHQLGRSYEGLSSFPAEERVAAGRRLYFEYNRFISDYLMHMDEEEHQTTEQFYQHFTDDELRAMEGATIASMDPADTARALGYMIPSIDATTRIAWIRSVKQVAPPPAFNLLMGVANQTLSPEAYARLEAALA
jgi:hypothetical protein